MNADLDIKVAAKVRGLWKLAFLTFLLRHVSTKHIVHVHFTSGKKTECIAQVNEPAVEKPPSLTGQ